MDLDSLSTFLQIAENQSFTKTAENLYCTQAAVSMRIKKLEHDLGCRLFIRKAKTVLLTEEGETFLPYANQILSTLDQARCRLLQTRLKKEALIKITSSSTPGTYLLPNILFAFKEKYPYITVVNHVQYSRLAVECVLNHSIPVAIVSQPNTLGTEELACEVLTGDPLVLVAGPAHPWTARKGIYLKEITNEVFLISNPHTSLIPYLENTGHFHLDEERLQVVGHIEAVKHSVSAGSGISFMSKSAVAQELTMGLLKEIPVLDYPNLKRAVYYVKRKDEDLNLSTQIFLDFIKEYVERCK